VYPHAALHAHIDVYYMGTIPGEMYLYDVIWVWIWIHGCMHLKSVVWISIYIYRERDGCMDVLGIYIALH